MTEATRQTAREIAQDIVTRWRTEYGPALTPEYWEPLRRWITEAVRSTLVEIERERDDFAGLYKSQAEEYKLARERLMIVAEDAMRAEARVTELTRRNEQHVQAYDDLARDRAELERMLADCETSLSIYDEGGSSEYWLRHRSRLTPGASSPTPPAPPRSAGK